MEMDFENFIAKRCECALMSDENYVKKEQGENVNEIELQIIVETICYKKGFSDAMKVIKCSQEMWPNNDYVAKFDRFTMYNYSTNKCKNTVKSILCSTYGTF